MKQNSIGNNINPSPERKKKHKHWCLGGRIFASVRSGFTRMKETKWYHFNLKKHQLLIVLRYKTYNKNTTW